MSSDIQNVPSLPNQTSIIELKNQSSSSVDGRVKKYAIKEITIEQVHLLKVELKNLALEKPSWYEYLFVHNPSLAHNREKYNLLRKEYLLLNNNYCRQEVKVCFVFLKKIYNIYKSIIDSASFIFLYKENEISRELENTFLLCIFFHFILFFVLFIFNCDYYHFC